MSKRGKRIFFTVLVLYVALVALFLVDVFKNRERAVLPVLAQDSLAVPADAADDPVIAGRRYRAREAIAGVVKEWGLIGADELKALREADRKSVLVYDTLPLTQFVARDLESAEELKVGDAIIVKTGEVIDEDKAVLLIAGRQGLQKSGSLDDGRIYVRGHGAAIGMNLTLAFTWFNFLALAALMYAVLWEPVLKVLDDRAEAIRKDIESSQARREEAEDLREKRKGELAELKDRTDSIVADARHKGHDEREKIVTEAREQAAHRLEEADLEVQRMAEAARKELRSELGGLATELSSKMLEREVSESDHSELISKFVTQVDSKTAKGEGK